jgi:hypothetical protein
MSGIPELQPGCRYGAIAFCTGAALFVLSTLGRDTVSWRLGWLVAAMICSVGALSAGYALQKREQPRRLAWATLLFNLLLPAGVLVGFIMIL